MQERYSEKQRGGSRSGSAQEDEIRLSDLFLSMYKRRILIAGMTFAGLVIGIIVSFLSFALGEVSREYAVTTSIAVTSQTGNGLFTTQRPEPNNADIHLAEDMVDSVIYIIKSDRLLNDAIDRLDMVGITPKDLTSHMHLTQYRDTQIVEITFYWRSAEEGVRILNAINEAAPKVLNETLKIGKVSVVNTPKAEYRVGGKMNANHWIIAAFLGFALASGFCVLKVLLFPTLVCAQDMEDRLGIEVLGEIPENHKFFERRHSPLSDAAKHLGADVREGYTSAAHILYQKLKVKEAGDAVTGSGAEIVSAGNGTAGTKYLYVTSSIREEGKTSAAANLGAELAALEKKVLLIDFDFGNPSLGSLFLEKAEYEQSMNALYRGDAAREGAVAVLNGYLDILPLVLNEKMPVLDDALLSLVREIADGYDYVIMDTAPVGVSADMLRLNAVADTAVLVVRYDTAGMKTIEETVRKLERSGVKITGCIVNGVQKIGKN